MASLMPQGKQQYFDSNGNNLSGGKLFAYASGTSTPLDTYSDQAGTIPNTNPVVLNARGEATIFWGSSAYKVVLKDASDVEIWTQDNLQASTGVADLASTSATKGAALVGFDGGTLADYMKNKSAQVVSSITALKAIDKTKFTRAFATGYYASGDGGGGPYWFDSTDTSSSDNGGTIIVALDGGRWKLAKMSLGVSIKQFGAKGDGVTDDTSAIQAAVNSVQASVGGELVIPVGTYLVTSISVPSGNAVQFIGEGNKSLIKTTSATADVLTIAAWYSKVEGIRFESTVTRTAGAFVLLSGAFTKVVRCEFAGDFYGIKMSGVGCKIQFNLFETPAANARRIWATGGDTSQTIQGNLMTAQIPVVASAGIFVDNSAALKIIDNDIIGQGRCLNVAPGNGQGITSLWSTGNFYDTATYGVAIEPSGTGSVRRCSFSDDWASSHTATGMLLSATGSAVIDGVDIDGCETNLNTQNGIALTGSGVTNVRIRNPIARQNNVAVSVDTATKWLVDGLRAEAADGLNANATGLFLASTNNYEVRDCDFTGQTTASITGHTTGLSTRIVKNNKGYVTESEGIATIATGNTTIVVAHGLSATPQRVFVSALGDPAGRFWSQQSSWDGANLTITQSGALGYNQPYAWRAVI